MEVIYRANDGIEAQLLVDRLEAEGIPAEIHGAYLQGAVGELPPGGLISILVNSENRERAREVVARWEAERANEPVNEHQSAVGKFLWSGLALLLGLALGVSGSFFYFQAPSSSDGVDYNDDGTLDEIVTYSPAGHPIRFEMDRNLDGRIDLILRYDRRNRIKDGSSDDDFDGTMETSLTYVRGNINLAETDTDGDGKPNIRWRYNKGVIDTVETVVPETGRSARIAHYHLNALVSAEVDVDLDGKVDTRVSYDALGRETESEVSSASKKSP
ncbi:DUF2007 domain-containing protein [Dokdonella sp.]|uniref:putative signal transducing protein n=1 Tax=Dokdonella sp. TaxID=2291710 RepID=UPI003528E9D3